MVERGRGSKEGGGRKGDCYCIVLELEGGGMKVRATAPPERSRQGEESLSVSFILRDSGIDR